MGHCLDIIPEDGAMRVLVEMLGFKRPNLGDGISVTLNKINSHFQKKFAVGLIDNDKRKPKLFDSYNQLHKEDHNLQLRQKTGSLHFLIVLNPAVEDWILENARSANLEFKHFSTRQELMRITKDEIEVAKNKQFKQFLNEIKQAKAPGFMTLTAWIKDLREQHSW